MLIVWIENRKKKHKAGSNRRRFKYIFLMFSICKMFATNDWKHKHTMIRIGGNTRISLSSTIT